ncbi:MFS transporter [Bacillus xiamenensis]|uniref:MFS transporter n=1 Tax=Bacillus xiamenensis TaxID=1178537 RepID=A0AAC9IFN9_9BACI|nr:MULTISPECIES: MFS transporter [Bacillus]AOZ88321.1 MFS transporter [Bacillus xiamenensis]EKF35864.1 putative 3-phenylpropionic acid transporter [Bacillus xiamenensis]MBG9912163.1 MFS transporter [Bacillus xiamenensis]MCW1838088.1 MFS transporter [Bacillus xiamenensis]MCY9577413.1 MFS transporter [Bacillus xiamenensis]
MNANKWMSMQFFGFFFTFGIFVPYWSIWLVADKNFSPDQAGIIIAIGLLTRAMTTFFLFPLASQYMGLARLNQWVVFLSVLLFVLLIPANSFLAVIVTTFFISLLYPMPLAMHEAMASRLMKKGEIAYGRSRSFGSFGYIVALLLMGIMISILGERVIIYVMIGGLLLFALLASLRAPSTLREKNDPAGMSIKKLFQSKSFVFVLLLCVILQSAHAAYYSYAVLFLGNLGVRPEYIGFLLLIAVIAEIVFFFISDSLFKKGSVTTLLMFSVTASIVRWMSLFLFGNVFIFILSQLLHAFTFGLTQVAFMKYLDRHIKNQFFPYAHGLYAALGLSLGNGLLTIVSGYLFSISPSYAFLGMAIICLPCFLLIYLLKVTLKNHNDHKKSNEERQMHAN